MFNCIWVLKELREDSIFIYWGCVLFSLPKVSPLNFPERKFLNFDFVIADRSFTNYRQYRLSVGNVFYAFTGIYRLNKGIIYIAYPAAILHI